MLIQSAGQPQEMSVCVLANDVSPSLSNALQFFPLSSFDRPASFLHDRTAIHLQARDVPSSLAANLCPVAQLERIYSTCCREHVTVNFNRDGFHTRAE